MKRMAIISIVLVFLLSLGMVGFRAGLEPVDLNEQYRNATVQLQYESGGHASGVVVADNVILTAKHCVEDVTELTVLMADGTKYVATKFLEDVSDDLALIIVDMNELAIMPIHDGNIKVGDKVICIGSPLNRGFGWNTTLGSVTSTGRVVCGWWENAFIIDAFAGPGNSGGPIIINGKLAGLCVGGFARSGSCMVICEPIADLDTELVCLIR